MAYIERRELMAPVSMSSDVFYCRDSRKYILLPRAVGEISVQDGAVIALLSTEQLSKNAASNS